MHRKLLLAAIFMGLATLPASAQSVDDIVAKYVQAMGGMDKLKAISTKRYTGKFSAGGLELAATLEQKRPNSVRIEFVVQGMTGVQAFDGKTGWQVMPFAGKKDPEVMGEDDLKDIVEQSDFDGSLVNYKEKGNKVELVGKEPVEGTDAYKLKVTLKTGDVDYVYLDTDTYLEIKEVSKRTIRGTERESESVFGDYKQIGGVMFAHSMEEGQKGSQDRQNITIEKIELNVPIDDSRFKMPEAKKAEDKKPGSTN